MAKTKEKNKAIRLRKKGKSIKDIAESIKIAKSTVSIWCRDIELTPEQIKKLCQKRIKGGYEGRIKGARMQHERRIEKIERCRKEGAKKIGKLSKRDLLIAGLSLYWGEGSKKSRSVRFSNSDPESIKFMIAVFKGVFGIKKDRFSAYIGINQIHKDRIEEVEGYWSKVAGIPRSQFTKTTLIKARNKKNYSNSPVHYGTVTIRIRKSADLYYQIMGLIGGLSNTPT